MDLLFARLYLSTLASYRPSVSMTQANGKTQTLVQQTLGGSTKWFQTMGDDKGGMGAPRAAAFQAQTLETEGHATAGTPTQLIVPDQSFKKIRWQLTAIRGWALQPPDNSQLLFCDLHHVDQPCNTKHRSPLPPACRVGRVWRAHHMYSSLLFFCTTLTYHAPLVLHRPPPPTPPAVARDPEELGFSCSSQAGCPSP